MRQTMSNLNVPRDFQVNNAKHLNIFGSIRISVHFQDVHQVPGYWNQSVRFMGFRIKVPARVFVMSGSRLSIAFD